MIHYSGKRWFALPRSVSRSAIAILIVGGLIGFWLGADILLLRGRHLVEQRQHRSAVRWLSVATALGTQKPEVYYQLSRAWRRLGDFEKSRLSLEKASERGWDGGLVRREQQLLAITQREFPDHIHVWTDLVRSAGSDLPEICEAFVYFRLARLETVDALEILRAWQAEYPGDARAYHVHGQVLQALERWKDAAEQLARAAELAPDRDDILLDLAAAQMQQLFYTQAIESLNRCLEINGENHAARVTLARAMAKVGQVDVALRMLSEDLERLPNRAEVLSALGELELSEGQLEPAVIHLREAAQLEPCDRETRYLLARALQRAGLRAEAEAEFEFVKEATEAITRLSKLTADMVSDPNNVELRFQVALINWKYESRETGLRWFQELLAIAPNHVPTHRILAEHYALEDDAQRSSFHRRFVDPAVGRTP